MEDVFDEPVVDEPLELGSVGERDPDEAVVVVPDVVCVVLCELPVEVFLPPPLSRGERVGVLVVAGRGTAGERRGRPDASPG